jgi:hypothetical protein
MGLWLRLGITGFRNAPLSEIFSLSDNSSLDAHATFTRDRYRLIISCLKFDNNKARAKDPDGNYIDKFVHLRKVKKFIFEILQFCILKYLGLDAFLSKLHAHK